MNKNEMMNLLKSLIKMIDFDTLFSFLRIRNLFRC